MVDRSTPAFSNTLLEPIYCMMAIIIITPILWFLLVACYLIHTIPASISQVYVALLRWHVTLVELLSLGTAHQVLWWLILSHQMTFWVHWYHSRPLSGCRSPAETIYHNKNKQKTNLLSVLAGLSSFLLEDLGAISLRNLTWARVGQGRTQTTLFTLVPPRALVIPAGDGNACVNAESHQQ